MPPTKVIVNGVTIDPKPGPDGMINLANITITKGNKKIAGKMRSMGNINDLRLANEAVRTRTDFVHIADNTGFITRSSPDCYWYFYGGYWYRICT